MNEDLILPMTNLQLFAEGGAGAGGSGTAQGAGVTGIDAGSQQMGVTEAPDAGVQAETEPKDRKAEFEALIRGQYKDLYDDNIQNIVQSRLKGSQRKAEQLASLQPVLELLGAKYGIEDLSDVKALTQALEEDDSFFEEEALKRGLTVEQYKGIRKLERENAELKRQMQQRSARDNADQLYASWMNQAEELKKVYPSFDLRREMANPQFQQLLRSNVPIRTAYEVLHKDEIIPAAMQFAAQTVEQKISSSIASGGKRPTENGNASQSASATVSDVSKLTRQQRQELIQRAARGEKIRF